jgi:hypothetical protein
MKDQFGVLEDRIVYLKPIDKADLPEEIFEQTGDIEQLWSVHNSEGEQLALVGDLAQGLRYGARVSLLPDDVTLGHQSSLLLCSGLNLG